MAKHIHDFLEEDYMDYAVYRIFQRLPHIADCMAQTQRKIIYTLESFPEAKKHKTAEVYSHVYTKTQYLHGDSSVYNVTENLARECSNNINLLTQEGSFGSRTSKAAAAPRYTGTRFSKAARLLFPKADEPIYRTQEFEGKPIEPQFMMPILPALLINGYSGIAVGFASKFLSRDPKELIDSMIKALTSKKKAPTKWKAYSINNIQPAFPFYNGNIIHDINHEDASAWILTGLLKKTSKRNFIEIYDVPPEYTRESYLKKLKKMLDKGIIKDFKESCRKNEFKIIIKVTPDLWKKSEDELLDILGLVDKVVENLTFVNPMVPEKPTIIKYDHVGEYLKDFIDLRQTYYFERKTYQLDKLKDEILVLHARIRFIEMVNNNEIVIIKRKKVDLEKELKTLEFQEIEGNYDYLLGMRIQALTAENVGRFKRFISDKEEEYQKLEKTSIEDMHIQELKALYKFIKPELEKKGLI
jgi:DNA topoisomerase-2